MLMIKIIRDLIAEMRSPGRSLSTKLCLSILLIVVPIFILALGALYLQSRYFIHQEASECVNSLLNTMTQRVRNYMSTIETSADANTWYLEEHFTPDTLRLTSQRIVSLNRHVYSCTISVVPDAFPRNAHDFSISTVNDGDSIVTVSESGFDYLDRMSYKAPIESGEACWVETFDGRTDSTATQNEMFATFCKPLRPEGDHIAGVVSLNIPFSQIAEILMTSDLVYPHVYFVLLDGDGRYLVHPDSMRLFKKTIFTDADPTLHSDRFALGHEMTAGKQGNMHITVGDQLCHVCYRPVPGTSWSLALVCPDGDILRSYHRLTYVIIALIFIGLLAILWLSGRAVRRAIRPINQLMYFSTKIADGNYDEMIPTSQREDVLGRLQNSFAVMQRSLREYMHNIHQTTEETKKRNEELVYAMKMAEEAVKQKSLFIQNVSHQIRTPLNIILGFAHVLRDSLPSHGTEANALHAKEIRDITGMMKHNAIHLKRMVLMLFDSSETGASEELLSHRSDEVSCNEVARECIDYTKTHFPGLDISFMSDLSDDVCILTNHLYLARSLRELLYNSAKFSDGLHIQLCVSQTDTVIRFTVVDIGPGLPEESQDLIFKPFTKVDDLSEGLGLGLPLAKRHVIGLGGQLIFDTAYQEGCRVIIEVPK